jgi:integral membrane protein (TIGR01906 family)
MSYIRPLRPLAVALFVLLVPLFLITTNVRLVINWPRLYSNGFDKYEDYITTYLDVERSEYLLAGKQIRDYFENDEELIDVRVVLGGIRQSIFNEREVLHMQDVKGLVRGVYRMGEAAALYLVVFSLAGLALGRRAFLPRLWRYVSIGGMVTLGLVVAVGLGALVGFDRLFLAFHLISFSNDFWQLVPWDDNLIAMFPQGFFFDATMWVALATIGEALVLAAVPPAIRIWRDRRAQREPFSSTAAA